jgi:hypothetical protein
VSLTVIAIANAVIWCGVIIFLLLRMMTNTDEMRQQIDRLEKQIEEPASKR